MKYTNTISSQRRVNRRRHFNADSNKKRIIMSSRVDKNFRIVYKTKTIPVRKGDEVKIMRGIQRGKVGKIVQSSRKGLFIYVSSATYKKMNGDEGYLPIHPSNVQIQKLILTSERKKNLGIK